MLEFRRPGAISRARLCALVLCLALHPSSGSASGISPIARVHADSFAPMHPPSLGHRLLFWLPNRLFDVLDILRLRVRAGPGFSASVRAMDAAHPVFGTHLSLFLGLPGPRGEPGILLPFGLENSPGLEMSLLEVGSEDRRNGPGYGRLEIGAGAQLLLVGLDVGVAPDDVLDLLAGILMLDPKGDDF